MLDKLTRFTEEHRGLSVAAAVNMLVDEALRMEEHPGVLFRTGPTGRRAVLASGPDVWEVIRAVKGTRAAEPDATPAEVVRTAAEYSGLSESQVTTAITYWSAYPGEIDARIEAAETAAREAEQRWRREQNLLAS